MSSTKMNITEKKYLISRCKDICKKLIDEECSNIFGKYNSQYTLPVITKEEILANLKTGQLKPFAKEEFIKQFEKFIKSELYFDPSYFIDGYDKLIEENKVRFKTKQRKFDKFKADIDKKLQDAMDEIMLGTSKEYALKLIKSLEGVK